MLSRKKNSGEGANLEKGTESELIQALREKKTWAYEKLYDQYAGLVGSIAKSYLNVDDVEDIIQEVFIRVYKSIKKFKGDASFSTWLYRIAVNACKDQLKKYAKRSETMIDFEEDDSSIETTSEENVEITVNKELDSEDITKILKKLNEEDRELIRLRDIQDLDYEEISAIVGKPLGTVKSRIHYARKKLKKLLLEYRDEGENKDQGGEK